MSETDFTLGYVSDIVVQYITDDQVGHWGPATSIIEAANVLTNDAYGAPAFIEIIDLTLSSAYGTPVNIPVFFPQENAYGTICTTIAVSGLRPSITFDRIICYRASGTFNLDTLKLSDCVVRPMQTNKTWHGRGFRHDVKEHVTTGTLESTNAGSYNFDTNSTGPITLTLPSDTPNGGVFHFVKVSPSGNFRVSHGGLLYTALGGAFGSSGVMLSGVGGKLSVVSNGTNRWVATQERNITLVA